eukprot:GAFH01003821.1.p1 GENE.GAFH01003821.1~~GAFH01003821.1.p1  ORF type:complete len:281 (-),score=43.09 GAFH01003821.1:40-858(-)
MSETEAPLVDLWADDKPRKKRVRRASPSPLVRVPAHSAAKSISYHPTDEEHQAALAVAVVHEKKIEARHQNYLTRIPVIRPLNVVDYQIEGLQKILAGQADGEEEEEEEEQSSTAPTLPKKRPERLTQADRNRKTRQRLLEQEQKRLAAEKKQKQELPRMRQMKKEILAHEEELLARMQERKKRRAERAPRIGPLRTDVAPVDVPLTEELADDLAHVKPASHLLKDQYRLFQEKGIIEARNKVKPHRRYKLKVKKVVPSKQFLKDMGVATAQ